MVFSSHLFLFYFLPLALLAYYAMPRWGKHLALTALSYLFYGWANPLFAVLLFTSTAVDYLCGLTMTGHLRRQTWRGPIAPLPRDGLRTRGQKLAVAISICSNLSLLGFFKYFNFATGSYDAAVGALGLHGLSLDLAFKITLPLGISFYTFQSMSYSIDVYRGHAKAIRQPIDFACYVSMFPQLVAGPIIRFQEVAEQLEHRTHTATEFARGVAFFCLGMGKKVLLANACGKVADLAFDAGSVGAFDAWVGVTAYAFQIYFDFSAYSDMAIGLGLMLGFVFPKNFDSPFHAASITEFWQRWHISLSTWLRDYLYIPLGGNRRGPARTYVHLAVIMVLGGLWHGAAWTYVLWGGLHGLLIALERACGRRTLYAALPRPVQVLITFVILHFTWVLFRANDLSHAITYAGSMLGFVRAQPSAALLGGVLYQPYYVVSLCVAAAITWCAPQTWDFTRRITVPKAIVIFGVFWLSIVALTTQAFNPFIYFIF